MLVGFEQLAYDVNENGGTVQVCAVITGEIESNVIVDLQTSDSAAEASRDYTALNTELTFVAPSTRACQDINILNDQLYEVDENFFGELTSSNPRVEVITARRRTTVEINGKDSKCVAQQRTIMMLSHNELVQLLLCGTLLICTGISSCVCVCVCVCRSPNWVYSGVDCCKSCGGKYCHTLCPCVGW